MEGRYDVEVCDECGREVSDSEHATSHHQNGPTHWVPVVPCDEAAIERASEAAAEILLASEIGVRTPPSWREIAEAVLRAAGEKQ